ncbi:MAG: succinate dehydrogenase [Clostridia bacterium]|nr:succinate dehydrogenase [Clostridia bacterium]
MKLILKILLLPFRLVTVLLILLCSLLIRCTSGVFSVASGLLFLLGLIVLTYSWQNALMVFALSFLVSPLGLPMFTVRLLALLERVTSL